MPTEAIFGFSSPWCRPRGLRSLPATAESLCAFLADEASAGRRASTLGRRLAAVFSARRPWTSAMKRGANLIKITDVTGHKSLEMLKTYSRDAEAFVGHAGAGLL